MFWQTKTKRVRRGQLFSLPRNVEIRKSPKSWRWKKCEIPLLLRDFQAEWESPAVGLFHAAAFSTAFLPANSATEPKKLRHTGTVIATMRMAAHSTDPPK